MKAQRLMGIQVDTLGNHNFDRGVAAPPADDRPRRRTEERGAPPAAPFKYVAANLKNLEENLSGVEPVRVCSTSAA